MPIVVKMDKFGLPAWHYFRSCDDTVGSFLLVVQALLPDSDRALQKNIANECWLRKMRSDKAKDKAKGRK